MLVLHNQNPLGRRVNDCVVRAISLATHRSWDKTYQELTEIAREEGTLLDDSNFVEHYLNSRYDKLCYRCKNCNMTLREFVENHKLGTYLVTMRNHITCVIDGEVYDTWNCLDKNIWCAWYVA